MAPPKKRPPADDQDDQDDEPATFNDQQREELGKLVNAAVGNQLGRKLDSRISEAMGTALSPITDKLEKLLGGKAASGDEGGADKGKAAPKEGSTGQTERERELQARLDAQDRKFAALDQERKLERDQRLAAKRDAALREELTKVGVDPLKMRGAIGVIRDAIKTDEKTGELFYKAQRDGYEEDLDLSKGVGEWAATEEGKAYKAAPAPVQRRTVHGVVNVIGKDADRGAGGAGKQAKAATDAAKADRKADALDKLGGAVNALIGGANIDVGG